jgi:hypothetical protein
MITPSPKAWHDRPPPSIRSPEPTWIRVDVLLSGEGKVFSYDRASEGAVDVVEFKGGDWEGMLLRLGNEGSPQRAEVLKLHRLGPVLSVVFQRQQHVA